MKKKGFTLIELIAVVAILAVLAVIAVPRVVGYIKKSKQVAIQTEARTIYDATQRACNEGIIKIKMENCILSEGQKPGFDYLYFKYVMDTLENNNLISSNVKDRAYILGRIPTIGWLSRILDTKVEDIPIDRNGVYGDDEYSGKLQ